MGEGEHLQKKYKLGSSEEVTRAARRKEARTGEDVPNTPKERIENYLDRFKEIIDREDPDERERGMLALKRLLHKNFVIKPDEVLDSYFDSIKKRHFEEGHGQIEISKQQRKELISDIVTEQGDSLDLWIDYFASPDAKYPDELKYWAFRSMLKLGRYDKEKEKFTDRYGKTVTPFPDLNRESLALVMDAMEKKLEGKTPDFGYDIAEDVKSKFSQYLDQGNFAKLYGLAIEEFKPISEELLKETGGEWIPYPEGSDPQKLVDSLKDYGTGWCIRGLATATRYLQGDGETDEGSDLEVYYSFDETGQAKVPRLVVVRKDGETKEIRGVAKQENHDQYIGPVVEQKLKDLPDGKLWKKKNEDMKKMTEVYEKVKHGEELSTPDLVFLYEINSPIEGFGYERDPRIEALRKQRTIEDDMPLVFGCEKEQIVRSPEAINEHTKAYVGKLADGDIDPETGKRITLYPQYQDIFHKIGHLDYLYTKFPERRLKKKHVTIGGKTPEVLEKELQVAGNMMSDRTGNLLKSEELTASTEQEEITIIRLSVADMGFEDGATIAEIMGRQDDQDAHGNPAPFTSGMISRLGLELCPAETGPHYRLQYKNQPFGEWIRVGMKPISDSSGDPYVFYLDHDVGGLWLRDVWAGPGSECYSSRKFAFRLHPRSPERATSSEGEKSES